MSLKHFIDIDALDRRALRAIIDSAAAMKRKGRVPKNLRLHRGAVLAMIFEKPSTRTRVSFEVAMHQLGGNSVVLDPQDMQLGRGETLADTARALSRYVDGIMLRTGPHETLTELAANASVPVINGLTCRSHPCQVMADVMTFEELKGPIEGRTIASSRSPRPRLSRLRPRCSIGPKRKAPTSSSARIRCKRRAARIVW